MCSIRPASCLIPRASCSALYSIPLAMCFDSCSMCSIPLAPCCIVLNVSLHHVQCARFPLHCARFPCTMFNVYVFCIVLDQFPFAMCSICVQCVRFWIPLHCAKFPLHRAGCVRFPLHYAYMFNSPCTVFNSLCIMFDVFKSLCVVFDSPCIVFSALVLFNYWVCVRFLNFQSANANLFLDQN